MIERLRLSDPVIAAIAAVVVLAASIWFLALWLNHGAGDLVITTDPTQGQIAVAIRGEVATPGVYRLGADARVADLIAAAGGTTSEADLGS
ncbi:MAG TPA: SLBB domain-containing protein, partial [Thermomicrobiales bacterium]|nr:SLBB domain-containing protein [Thermomicrobiales bacterium]